MIFDAKLRLIISLENCYLGTVPSHFAKVWVELTDENTAKPSQSGFCYPQIVLLDSAIWEYYKGRKRMQPSAFSS